MTETKIGKIQKAEFGFGGGGDDRDIGLHLEMGGRGWGVQKWIGTRHAIPARAPDTVELLDTLDKTLLDAEVTMVSELVGKPVEVVFENRSLKSWRILVEVL